jgi:hypothetical protein
MTIHQKLKNLGIEIHGHYSDLYVEVTRETAKIVEEYRFKNNVSTFRSQIDGKLMFDIPLASDDFLESRKKKID